MSIVGGEGKGQEEGRVGGVERHERARGASFDPAGAVTMRWTDDVHHSSEFVLRGRRRQGADRQEKGPWDERDERIYKKCWRREEKIVMGEEKRKGIQEVTSTSFLCRTLLLLGCRLIIDSRSLESVGRS